MNVSNLYRAIIQSTVLLAASVYGMSIAWNPDPELEGYTYLFHLFALLAAVSMANIAWSAYRLRRHGQEPEPAPSVLAATGEAAGSCARAIGVLILLVVVVLALVLLRTGTFNSPM